MKIELTEKLIITTEHSSSSYGIPVIVDNEGNSYGPGDIFPQSVYSRKITFREMFEELGPGNRSLYSDKQKEGISKFLGEKYL